MRNNTATPYVLAALFLVSGVIFGEYWLKSQLQIEHKIQLVATQNDADEDKENTTTIVLQPVQLERARLWLTELTNGLAVNSLVNDPRLLSLAEDTRLVLFSYLGVALVKAKNFNGALELLGHVDVMGRLNHNSQFSYAYAQFKTKHPDQALNAYQALLEYDPQHQSAALNKGLLLKRMQRCDQAISAFEYSIRISSGVKKSKSHAGLSACYVVLKQYTLAQKHLATAIEYRPSYAKNWRSMAALTRLQGQPFKVVNDLYGKAAQLDEKGHKILLEWAEYKLAMLDFTGAIQALRNAQSRAKKSITIRRLLAISYLEAGKPNNTRKQSTKLLQVENNSQRKIYASALLEYAKGNYTSAYTLSKKLPNKKRPYRYLRAISAAKAGKRTISKKILSTLLDDNDYQFRASRQLALVHKARKNYSEATRIYARLTEVQAYSSALWKDRASLAQKLNNPQQAIKYLDQGISIANGKDKGLILAKSKLLKQLNNIPGAISLLNQLSSQYPNNLHIRKLLADSLYDNGQHIEAFEHYKLQLNRNPNDVSLLYRLAGTAMEQSDWAESISFLNLLLEQQADHIEARYFLAKSYCNLDKELMCKQQAILTLRLKDDHSGAKALLDQIRDKEKA